MQAITICQYAELLVVTEISKYFLNVNENMEFIRLKSFSVPYC